MNAPSTNGDSGRSDNGRFAPGNKIGRGNPFNKRAMELRSALLETVTPEAVKRIVASMVTAAENGDTVAAREILNRVIGTPSPCDVLARLETLEAAIAEKGRL